MKTLLRISILLFAFSMSFAQFETNYEESKVPEFTVPDPLTTFAGENIISSSDYVPEKPNI